MKKLLSLILAVALGVTALFCFASCAPQTEFDPEGEIKGTLKLGFDATFYPYGSLDAETNEYVGFDIDLAKLVAKKLNYKLVLVPIDWNAKDSLLESGVIDCIWNGFTIQDREDDYEWTPAYSNSSIVVLTKDDLSINTLADLAGKKVMVQAGSSGESALSTENADGTKTPNALAQTFKDGNYVTTPDYANAFTELQAGGVQAVVVDIGVAQKQIAGKEGYKILDEVITEESYGIGFKLGNTALRDLIWDTIVSLDKAEIKAIAVKYGIEDAITIDDD